MIVIIDSRFFKKKKNTLSKIIDNPSCLLLTSIKKKKSLDPLICSFHKLYCIQVNLDVLSSRLYLRTFCVQESCLTRLGLCFDFPANAWHFACSGCSINIRYVDHQAISIHSENIPRENRRQALFNGNTVI